MPRKPVRRSLRDVVLELGGRASPDDLPSGYGPAVIAAAVEAGEVRYRPDGALEPAPRMGRPPRGATATSVRIDVKATPEQVRLWRAAAEAEGVGLRPWLADVATAAARKVRR